jgi:hypothetical protein
MTHRLVVAVLLIISVSGLLAPPASAEITSVSAAGPGGTVSSLAIETTYVTDDSVQFDANYTSPAQIVFTLTVDGSGAYFIGAPFGDVTNSTSTSFPSLFAYLVEAPVGTTLNEAGWDSHVFSNGPTFIPSFPITTEVAFTGPPGLGSGASTDISVGFAVPVSVSGPYTVEVVLTPTAAPEPSTWALLLLGFAGIGYVGYRRAREPRAV